MVELEASTQKGSEVHVHWKRNVPDRPVTLGRLADQSEWAAPWDDQISRKHVVLTWDLPGRALRVQVLPNARNPTYYDGRRYGAGEEFTVQVGHRFIIGETLFSLISALEPAPPAESFTERTCSQEEVRSFPYADAEKRIEVLSALPEMIRHSASDVEFEERVVEVLLQGVPRGTICGPGVDQSGDSVAVSERADSARGPPQRFCGCPAA